LLEHFHVAPEDEVRVIPDALNRTVTDVFLKMGMSVGDAELASEVLESADVRGVDTHGVSNMLRRYVDMFNDKLVNPTPELKILRETPSTANVDADEGLGCEVHGYGHREGQERGHGRGDDWEWSTLWHDGLPRNAGAASRYDWLRDHGWR